MISVNSAQKQFEAVLATEDNSLADAKNTLVQLTEKIVECARSSVKRSRERALEEADRLLRGVPKTQVQVLSEKCLHALVQLIVSVQIEIVSVSSACRKLDQMLQSLSEINRCVVFGEVQRCIDTLLHKEQMLTIKDLQTICMFMEDSASGRGVLRQFCSSLLLKLTQLLPMILQEESLRNGPLCYQTVKVCLQVFQLLPEQVTPLVFGEQGGDLSVKNLLEFLMSIILGESSSRDTRLLAGTTVAMLVNTASHSQDGQTAVNSLLQLTHSEPWCVTVGKLKVQCSPVGQDGVDRLSIVRGLLTCCRGDILVCNHDNSKTCPLLDGLFPVISTLCGEKLDCHYFIFQVYLLWLKCVREYLTEVWEVTGAPLLGEDSSLRQRLLQLIWDNAESRLEGMSESVRSALSLVLEVYETECEHFGSKQKLLYSELLRRLTRLPWEWKAKYAPLCALLPYVSAQTVLQQYADLPAHILKCLSTNHLTPSASELYKSLIQEQRREFLADAPKDAPPTEAELASRWAEHWRETLLECLMSDVTLLQSGGATCLLPSTLRVFPAAADALLTALDPTVPGHLRTWACVMSTKRTVGGQNPWASEPCPALDTLHLALSSADDSVRLAGLNLLCCSGRSREPPTQVEFSALRRFIPLNLNSESSPFRQQLQAAARKFLVRVRDCCMASLKGQKSKRGLSKEQEAELKQGVEFVDWLAELMFVYLSAGHSYQRKKTVLLLLSVVMETCTDTWSPERKKGQPPADMSSLITWATDRGHWDFFSRSKQLVLIGCLEDSTNEIRELAGELLVRFFPPSLSDDVSAVLCVRAAVQLHSPRVQQAQAGALMMKLLLQKCVSVNGVVRQEVRSSTILRFLLRQLKQHCLNAQSDMLHAARTTPIHGVVSALQRCVLEVPGVLRDALDSFVAMEMLNVLETLTRHLLGVLFGDQDTDGKEVPPSFCDMGNAISSLIGQGVGLSMEGEESVLLSEEHSLVLTCCWVSLKEIGIFLGSLVERMLSVFKEGGRLWTTKEMKRVSKVFRDILLKCRHWGAVEGCCVGFTKFCTALLHSSDPDLRQIPSDMLQQGLAVLQSAGSTSVTRRAAGLPMLILCILSAEDSGKTRPLLAQSIRNLLERARDPVPHDWDQTVDLPQVCAVHILNTLVRGSSLSVAILHYAPTIAILSLRLLSSPCWAMRNAALQLYSSLCWRLLGQNPVAEESSDSASQSVKAQYGMSPPAFFGQYPALQPFLLGELQRAAKDLKETRLSLHPSLYPILTLLSKLQPGAHQHNSDLSEFQAPLLQLAASPIYGVRVMSSKALVAMTPPAEYSDTLLRLVEEIPESAEGWCCHNRLHGQLLQIRAILKRAVTNRIPSVCLREVVCRFEARLWLATPTQRCPVVRDAYLGVATLLKGWCSETFLNQLGSVLLSEIQKAPHTLELGSASYHQTAVHFLCQDPRWACQAWQNLSTGSDIVRLSLVRWVVEGCGWRGSSLQQVLEKALQDNLQVALLQQNVEYKSAYLSALVAVLSPQTEPSSERVTLCVSDCVETLLKVLEHSEGGVEFLAQALHAVSVLLFYRPESGLLERCVKLLEVYGAPEAPESMRLACAQALCVVSQSEPLSTMHSQSQALNTRLITTGVCLLQDECVQVRMMATRFASLITSPRRPSFPTHVNQSMHSLLDLLLQEFWDSPDTWEVLIGQLPQCELSMVLRDTQDTQCVSLYEQDDSNVFAEPGVLVECVLPYLLRLAIRAAESPVLTQSVSDWAQQNSARVQHDLTVCSQLFTTGGAVEPAWLSVLCEPRFHGAVCGLFARAVLLLCLLHTFDGLRCLLDSVTLHRALRETHTKLHDNGVFLSSVFMDYVSERGGVCL
ncbi:thyroid adenoma-associated protein homolog [Chanos chanos]|uniref:Thyroid adenoma-associated protein homolog n=1 Tax=Chanos chanos TaxID=29144 RepID=A0A6J2WTJ9_CHACN|nr:thyroid adenoma-associated protein homolog [Chanos chanos]